MNLNCWVALLKMWKYDTLLHDDPNNVFVKDGNSNYTWQAMIDI